MRKTEAPARMCTWRFWREPRARGTNASEDRMRWNSTQDRSRLLRKISEEDHGRECVSAGWERAVGTTAEKEKGREVSTGSWAAMVLRTKRDVRVVGLEKEI
jgi:hypothetical protein